MGPEEEGVVKTEPHDALRNPMAGDDESEWAKFLSPEARKRYRALREGRLDVDAELTGSTTSWKRKASLGNEGGVGQAPGSR